MSVAIVKHGRWDVKDLESLLHHDLIVLSFFGMIRDMGLKMNVRIPMEPSLPSAQRDDVVYTIPRKTALPLRIFYRIRQFVRGLMAGVRADEMLVAAKVLPRAALAHFCQMPLDAQRHSLNVLYTLRERGCDDPDLAAAALLHDVGKVAGQEAGLQFTPWLRGPLVLLDALAPQWVARWADADPARGWRYLLHVHRTHPAIGGQWAATAGCSELTCWLIEHHQDELHTPPQDYRDTLLHLLQWADSRN